MAPCRRAGPPRQRAAVDESRWTRDFAGRSPSSPARRRALSFDRGWTPINEPLTTARFSALYGHWYPHPPWGLGLVPARAARGDARYRGRDARDRARRAPGRAPRADGGFGATVTRGGSPIRRVRERAALASLGSPAWRRRPDPSIRAVPPLGRGDPGELPWLLGKPCPPDIGGLNYYLTSDRYLDDRLELYPHDAAGGNSHDVVS